jgi:mannose-6-phosphate isomerase-like protein (cupin superfamily)
MDAFGARIGGERSPPPEPAPIRRASPDRVDLDLVGFEAEAFGIDRRRIAPGGAVPRPSTGGNRWLVLCREGEVVVARADNREIALVPGELSFVPAGVDFDVRNQSDARAVVELVYSRAVTPAHGH